MAKFLISIHVEVQASTASEAARLGVIKALDASAVDVSVDGPNGLYESFSVSEDSRVAPILLEGGANAIT